MHIPAGSYWRLLRSYLRPMWLSVAFLALLLGGNIGLQLYNPTVLKQFIDSAAAGAPPGRLIGLGLAFLASALAVQAVSLLATYVSQNVGWRATNQLRLDLTRHVLDLDLAFHTSRSPGELIERIDGDATLLANFFSQFVIRVVGNLLLMAGMLVALFLLDWRAGAAITCFAVLNLLGLLWTRGAAKDGWLASRQTSAEYFGFLGERLTGTEDIRANGAEPYVLRGFYQMLRRRLGAELKAGRGMAITLVVSFGLIALGMSTAFAISAYLVSVGAISLGSAYMVFAYTEQLRRPVEQVIAQIQDLSRAEAGIGRIEELLRIQPAAADGDRPLPVGPLAVHMASVSFGYTAEKRVLQDFSLSLEPGQVLGVLGRTGSGKSTVTRLLARLYHPDKGSVFLGGVPLHHVRSDHLRERVAVVTQDVQLFQGTVRENLTLFDRGISDARIWQALDQLGLRDWAESLPSGLNTELAGGGGLSGGEAQLLAFARAFLKDPGLVILDEASARLDPATERRLERAVDQLLQGRTAILIAHRLTTIERADRILIVEDGCVVEQGVRSELVAAPNSRFHRLMQLGAAEESA